MHSELLLLFYEKVFVPNCRILDKPIDRIGRDSPDEWLGWISVCREFSSLRSNINSIVEPDNHLIKSWSAMGKEQWRLDHYSQWIAHSIRSMDRSFMKKLISRYYSIINISSYKEIYMHRTLIFFWYIYIWFLAFIFVTLFIFGI